jgi:hypothetical protein
VQMALSLTSRLWMLRPVTQRLSLCDNAREAACLNPGMATPHANGEDFIFIQSRH